MSHRPSKASAKIALSLQASDVKSPSHIIPCLAARLVQFIVIYPLDLYQFIKNSQYAKSTIFGVFFRKNLLGKRYYMEVRILILWY